MSPRGLEALTQVLQLEVAPGLLPRYIAEALAERVYEGLIANGYDILPGLHDYGSRTEQPDGTVYCRICQRSHRRYQVA